LIAVNDIKT